MDPISPRERFPAETSSGLTNLNDTDMSFS